MKTFREIPAHELEPHSLTDEMSRYGYELIRGLLPRDALNLLLEEITQILSKAGWLLPDCDPIERMANSGAACGDPDPVFKRVYEEIFSLESLHAFAHLPELREAMVRLAGEQLFVHPKPIVRLIFPNCERLVIHAHQDHQSIAGDAESFTAWIPLHDCPAELGPLQILEASHHYGLQEADPATGYVSMETARGDDWVGGQINAGDVLIFHSLTVHAASPNISNQLRISMDCRFQNYGRALNPSTLVFPGASGGGRTWEKTYANWRSDELKYYWKRLPLQFKPSKAELRDLAQTAELPEMRARYARILSQLEAQIPE